MTYGIGGIRIIDYEPNAIEFDDDGKVKGRKFAGKCAKCGSTGLTGYHDLHCLSDPLSVNPSVLPLAEAI